MSINDVLDSNLIQSITEASVIDTLMIVGISFLLGLFIQFIYNETYQGVDSPKSFRLTIVLISIITSTIILAVVSNIVLSLGMVGALSIVRFRSAIKEPLDIAFLFWAISIGIILAAGLLPLAVLSSLFMGVVALLFSSYKQKKQKYLLVISYKTSKEDRDTEIGNIIHKHSKRYMVKSKVETQDKIDLNIEVKLKINDTSIVKEIKSLDRIENVALFNYSSYMG